MFALFAGLVVVMAGCLKDNTSTRDCSSPTTTAPATEIASVKAYLDSIGVTASQDSRGFFYTIDSSASTVAGHPTGCSDVSVTYVGKFTNGIGFDSSGATTPVSFGLYGNLITGWKEAIPLMKANSTMNLYLPPSLAYGATGYPGAIPANAILIFNIKLLGFN